MTTPRLPPLALLLRIDRRRAASWLALGMAAAAASSAAVPAGRDATAAGIVTWSLAVAAAVAACGDLPLPLCPPPAAGGRTWVLLWAAERILWPLVGLAAAGVAAAVSGSDPQTIGWPLAGLLLTGASVAGARLAGASAADAAAVSIMLAGGVAVPAVTIDPQCAATATGVATAAWLVAVALVFAWSREASGRDAVDVAPTAASVPSDPDEVRAEHRLREWLPARGPLRRAVLWLAMGTALVMMAGWGVLGPDAGADARRAVTPGTIWGLVSLLCFSALAAAQATLQDGLAGSRGRERLERAAAGVTSDGGTGSAAWLPAVKRPGPVRTALVAAGVHAAVLGWPPLVTAVVAVSAGPRAAPAGVVVVLVAAAAVLATIAVAGFWAGASRETTFALAVAALVGLAAVWLERRAADAPSKAVPAQAAPAWMSADPEST